MELARTPGLVLLAALPAWAWAASPLDGFWMKVNEDKSLDPGSQVEYRVDKHFVRMNTPQGASYKAKIDGPDAPVAHNPNTTAVSVRMEGPSTLVQTEKNGAKPWYVTTIEVNGDGKTATVTWKNLKNNTSGTYTMSRQ